MDVKGFLRALRPGKWLQARDLSLAQRRQIIATVILVAVLVVAFVVLVQIQKTEDIRPAKGGFAFPRRAADTGQHPLLGAESTDLPPTAAPVEDEPETAQSDSPDETTEDGPPESPEEQFLREARNALDPKVGITKIERFLSTLDNLQEASKAYSALAGLYLDMGSDYQDEAEGALLTARDLATSAEARHEASHALVTALIQRGDTDQARQEALFALDYDDTPTVAGARIRVALGRLHERAGDNDQAEAAYKQAADDALAMAPRQDSKALPVHRQACLCLARLYRKLERDDEADAVAESLAKRLGRAP